MLHPLYRSFIDCYCLRVSSASGGRTKKVVCRADGPAHWEHAGKTIAAIRPILRVLGAFAPFRLTVSLEQSRFPCVPRWQDARFRLVCAGLDLLVPLQRLFEIDEMESPSPGRSAGPRGVRGTLDPPSGRRTPDFRQRPGLNFFFGSR